MKMAKNKGKSQQNIACDELKQKESFFIKSENSQLKDRVMKNKVDAQSITKKNTTDTKDQTAKKPFDKKQWRLKKYSHKYKVEKWKEMRKKKILNEYQKVSKRKDCQGLDVQKIYEKYDVESESDDLNTIDKIFPKVGTSRENVNNDKKISKLATAIKKPEPKIKKTKLEEIKEEKEKKQEEYIKKKAEKEEAFKLFKKKKAERYKRLNKRTKKGQPIMKDRMEMLFEQVQHLCQDEKE